MRSLLELGRSLSKLLRLPAGQRRLLVKTALLLEGIKFAVRLLPFRIVRRLLDWAERPLRRGHRNPLYEASVDEISRAVALASRYTPGTKTCLTQALALRLLLVRRGYPATLRIGVVREGKERLQAHAWVESAGRVLIGDYQLERYAPLIDLEGKTARAYDRHPVG